ncbi:hypothetical protein SK128_000444, partial [Halocaridina rubra]
MTATPIPLGTLVLYTATTTRLTMYAAENNNSYNLVQASTGFFIKMDLSTTWAAARSNCRAEGFGMFTPTTLESLRSHLDIFGPFWTGTSDTDSEGSYVSEEGAPMPSNNGMYCANEPNNAGGNEDCIEAVGSPGCLNDRNCG